MTAKQITKASPAVDQRLPQLSDTVRLVPKPVAHTKHAVGFPLDMLLCAMSHAVPEVVGNGWSRLSNVH
jgi:hypothetical protein